MIGRLADDPDLRAEVETARRLGIPLRVWRGWTPARETLHYDTAGTLTGRSVGWVESGWDEQARAEMLALHILEAQACPACGGPRDVCQAREATDSYEAIPVRCHRMDAVLAAQDVTPDRPRPGAVLWATNRKGDHGG